MMLVRRGVVAIVAAVAVVAAGGAWWLGQSIRSPAEIAAAARPPEPSLLTVPVELRRLDSTVVIRGTAVAADATDISIPAGDAVITNLPKEQGESVAEGEVVAEVSGRPIIVLQGDLPEYRSLGPNMEGPDVRQLEQALLRLGYEPGDVDEQYSAQTASAIVDLYRDIGYEPIGPTTEELDQIDVLRSEVASTRRAIAQASTGAATDPPRSQLLQLDQAITQATEAIDDAGNERSTQLADADQAQQTATADHASAEQQVQLAADRLSKGESGVHPDSGAPITDSELGELASEVSSARQSLEAAKIARDEAAAAYDELAAHHDRQVRDAEIALEIAKATKLETLDAAKNSDASGQDVVALKDQLAQSERRLAELQSRTGVTLPIAEFRFVKTLPSIVQTVNVKLGSEPQGSILSIAGSSNLIEAAIGAGDRRLLQDGMTATVDDEGLGLSFEARITDMAEKPGGSDLAPDQYALTLTPTTPVPEELMYQSVRITVAVSSTDGEVLAVPLAALSVSASGDSRVEIEQSDGRTDLVEVTVGLAADGYVEVEPLSKSLTEGDRVVIGWELHQTSSVGPSPVDTAAGKASEEGDEG